MIKKTRVVFSPIGYIGIILAVVGILPNLLNTRNSLIQLLGVIVFIVGLALVFKGRKEE